MRARRVRAGQVRGRVLRCRALLLQALVQVRPRLHLRHGLVPEVPRSGVLRRRVLGRPATRGGSGGRGVGAPPQETNLGTLYVLF